jgi:hypothetical protein
MIGTTFLFRDEGVGNMTVIEGIKLDSDSGDVFANS